MNTYKESQPILPLWLLRVVIAANVLLIAFFGYVFYQQEVVGELVGENPINSYLALGLAFVVTALIYFVSTLKITIRIADETLFLRMGSMGKRDIQLATISSVEDYVGNPAKDFLGFGYRFGLKQTGYVGRAEDAVVITLQDESRQLVVTTKNKSALKNALAQ